MSITRASRRTSFTVIDNTIINDDRIKSDTLGLFIYLLSKPDNWKVRSRELAKRFKCGKDRIYRMLTELQEMGFAKYSRKATGETDWLISEVSHEQGTTAPNMDGQKPHPEKPDEGQPHPEKPDLEKPDLENPDVLIKTDKSVKTDENKNGLFENWQDDLNLGTPFTPSDYWKENGLTKEISAYRKMRRQIKKPMNEISESRLIKRHQLLVSEGNDKRELILKAVEKCWQSLYPLSEDSDGTYRQKGNGTSNRTVSTPADRNAEATTAYLRRGNDQTLVEAD